MAEGDDPGIDRQEVLRELEAAVFERSSPSVFDAGEEEPGGSAPEPESRPSPAAGRAARREVLAGAVLGLAGAAWLAAASSSRGWAACVLSAAFLSAGLLLLGRAFLREKP